VSWEAGPRRDDKPAIVDHLREQAPYSQYNATAVKAIPKNCPCTGRGNGRFGAPGPGSNRRILVPLGVFAEQAPGSLTIQAEIGPEPLELHVIRATSIPDPHLKPGQKRYLEVRAKTSASPKLKPYHRKGLVTDVSGLMCKGCSGTLKTVSARTGAHSWVELALVQGALLRAESARASWVIWG
jgi:hypothetical protein